MEIRMQIKPMSVNEAWRGTRKKTPKYLRYQHYLLLTMPHQITPEPPYRIFFEFGMSNVLSDWDNPVKPLQDILQKKYKFNDKDIHEASVRKVKVNKGEEYFAVKMETII